MTKKKKNMLEVNYFLKAKFHNLHFLIVIDELLEYLKGRNPNALHRDLMLLRQLGEACDKSRSKIIFGFKDCCTGRHNSRFRQI